MLPKLLFSIIVAFIVGIGYCDTTLDIYSPSHLIPREETVSAIGSVTSFTLDTEACPNNRRSRISRQSQLAYCYQQQGQFYADAAAPQDSFTVFVDDEPAIIAGLGTYQPPGQQNWYPNFQFSNPSAIPIYMSILNLRNNVDYPPVPMAPDYTHNYYLVSPDNQPPGWNNDDPILFKAWWNQTIAG
jgi:hypothetical protein